MRASGSRLCTTVHSTVDRANRHAPLSRGVVDQLVKVLAQLVVIARNEELQAADDFFSNNIASIVGISRVRELCCDKSELVNRISRVVVAFSVRSTVFIIIYAATNVSSNRVNRCSSD